MSNVLFCSDLHLGHKNIHVHRKFVTSEEHNYSLIHEGWHKHVKKDDVVYVLGDCAFTEERLLQFKQWKGRKILIAGNHDSDHFKMKQLCEVFDDVYGLLKYKGMWLSHAPIHPSELRGKINIHGHTHYHNMLNEDGTRDERYINVSVEQLVNEDKDGNYHFTPISLEQIRKMI